MVDPSKARAKAAVLKLAIATPPLSLSRSHRCNRRPG
jgi:hypothetical protein